MADREYVISYDTSSALKGAKNIDAFTASIVKHDAATASDLAAVKKQAAAYNELATAAGKATKMVDGLAASMAAATAQANSFATATTGAGVASLDLEKSGKAASATVRAFAKNMDGAATSSKAAAHGIDQAAAAARSGNIPIGSMGTAVKTTASGFRAFGKAASTAATNTTAVANAANNATAALNNAGTAGLAAKAGLQGVGSSAAGAVPGVDGLMAGLAKLVSTAAALGVLRKVVGEMGEAIKEARQFDTETADSGLAKRDKARELGNLMGEAGPTDRVMGRVFGTALSSGLSFDESLKFLEQFEGSIPAGVQAGHVGDGKNGTIDQKPAIARAAAATAARLGLAPETAGDMAGVITQHMNVMTDKNGKPISPEKAAEMVAAKMQAIAYGLNEGRGKLTSLARSDIASSMMSVGAGRVESDEEQAALVGVTSLFSKTAGSAGTKWSQVSNLLNRVGTNPEIEKFLAESGVDAAKGDIKKLQALKAHLTKENPADINTYLAKHGFGSKEERESISAMMQYVGSDAAPNVMERRISEAKRMASDPGIVNNLNAGFAGTKTFANRQAETRVDAAEFEHGKKTEDLQIARKNAAARLISAGTFKDQTQLLADKVNGGFGVAEFMGLPSAMQQRIDEEVAHGALSAARESGVRVHDRKIQDESGLGTQTKESLDLAGSQFNEDNAVNYMKSNPEATARVLKALSEAGVNVYGGDAGVAAKQRAADRDPTKAKAAAGAKVPAAVPGNPAPNAPPTIDTTSLDRAGDKLNQAADKLVAAMQQANMPGLPTSFGQGIGGYRA